jgi:carbamoyltransferase
MYSPEQFVFSDQPLPEKYAKAFNQEGGGTAILGIGTLTHDTSAALICSKTGQVLYASSEERLSNQKHDSRFPIGAITKCCEIAMASGYQIKQIAVNFDPDLFFPSLIQDELSSNSVDNERAKTFLAELRALARRGIPLDLENDAPIKGAIQTLIRSIAKGDIEFARTLTLRISWYFNMAVKYRALAGHIESLFQGVPVRFVAHHDCHAASAFYGSGLRESAVLVIDGHGEVDTTTIYRGDAKGLQRVASTRWPASLGSVYLAVTRYLGFDYGDEYKVMGMAAYGRPNYISVLVDSVRVTAAGEIEFVDSDYFCTGSVRGSGQIRFTIRDEFQSLCPVRRTQEPILQEHFDLAASVQSLVEKIGVALTHKAQQLTGLSALSIAGGVGLNGLMNEAIRRSGVVSDIFIYPAASDDGTSAGAAMALLIERGFRPERRMNSCYSGYVPGEGEIEAALAEMKIRFSRPDSINRQIAEAVANGKIIARYVGAAEYGPRALGNRSILANPAIADMKDILNLRIKHREQFRPFAPACMREHVNEYFEFDGDAPFMIMIVHARESAKTLLPSVVHNDGTARVQTITREQSPDFYRTLTEFKRITGIPVMINTSFNVNGEAIVDSARDAIESFAFMDIDFLALGDYWISKTENPNLLGNISHEAYLSIRKERYRKAQTAAIAEIDVRKYGPWFFPDANTVEVFARNVVAQQTEAVKESDL